MKYRPPPVGIWFTVRPCRRRERHLRCLPERRHAGLTSLDDFPCPGSLRRAGKKRDPGDVVSGHQLPARRARHDVVGDADLVLLGGPRSPPAPTWRISSCARAAGGVRRRQPCKHSTARRVLRALDTLKRGMRHLHDAIAESIRLFPALAVDTRSSLACAVTPAPGALTPGTRAYPLRLRHALASMAAARPWPYGFS